MMTKEQSDEVHKILANEYGPGAKQVMNAETGEYVAFDGTDRIPTWMRRPCCPGLWVCKADETQKSRDFVLELTQNDLDRGAPFLTSVVFGPIPSPPAR